MKTKSLRSAFWSRAGAVSIRTKITGIVALCILATSFALVWYAYHDVSRALTDQLQRRGIAIGTDLAIRSRNMILTDNQVGLYALLTDARDADKDIYYAFILDDKGRVLVHTFDGGFPADLLGLNQVQFGNPYQVLSLQTESGMIQDIAVPILGGKAGIMRLGMAETSVTTAVYNYIRNILLWVVLVLGFGLFLAYALTSVLTVPISQLVEAAQAVGRGDFRWKTPVWTKDEVGSLGAAFNNMSADLKRKEEMREQLLAKVIRAQEEERKRIARELHDETGQALTSLMVGLKSAEESADAAQVREKIPGLRALAAQTLNDVHRMATDLRPSLLDDLGLVAATEKYIKEYSAQMNINVDSHLVGLNERRLPSETEVAIYRIIQEALTNVAKYARASNVSIVTRYRDSALVVVIEDDGVGFDVNWVLTSPDDKKLGLFGMQERASLIGGKLTIESKPNEGTTVFLEVPLDGKGR